MELKEIIKAVHSWTEQIERTYVNKLKVWHIKETENIFIADIDSENCLARLIVEPEGFHPHRHVEMTLVRINDGKRNAVPFYCYYDKNGDSIEDIINELDKCIEEMR